MATVTQHMRLCLLYEFQQGKNASTARESIYSVLGADIVSYETCNYWYKRFRNGEFDLSDQPRPGQPRKFEDARKQQELAAHLRITRAAISKRLHQLVKIQKLGRWVPHVLTEHNLGRRMNTCPSLFGRHQKRTSCRKW